MEVNNKSSVLEKYCIEKVSSEEAEKLEKNMTGWRVLCNLGQKNMNNLGSFNFFKTDNKAWISEFYFTIVTIINQRILLVSPECPEYLFIDPSDLVDVVGEYEVELNEGVMKLFDDWVKIGKNSDIVNPANTYYYGDITATTSAASTNKSGLYMSKTGNLYYYDGNDCRILSINNVGDGTN